jgi:WD40 repeat protein
VFFLVVVVAIVSVLLIREGLRPCAWLDIALKRSGCICTLEEHEEEVDSLAFSPDGTLLALGLRNGTVRMWRVEDRELLRVLKTSISPTVEGVYSQDVAFSPDGKILAFGSTDGNVRLWRVSDGRLLHTLEGRSGRICSLDFSPDGGILALGTWDGPVQRGMA